MKRSEMIEIIEAELYMIQNIEGNNQEFLTSIAKGILDRIEECGMLPPYFAGNLSNYDIAMGSNPYRWEHEDA